MRLLAAVLVPNLPVALARRRGQAPAGAPLLLYARRGGAQPAVHAASEETGAAPGMSLRRALLRCPAAAVLPADEEGERRALAALRAALDALSPRVADLALPPDAALVADLGRLQGPAPARGALRAVAAAAAGALGVPVAVGAAASPFVAHLAAHVAGAGGARLVLPGEEAAFLAPLPVELLLRQAPAPGARDLAPALVALRLFGLRTAGDVAALGRAALQAQLGALGAELHDMALGRASELLAGGAPEPRVALRRRFAGPVSDGAALERAVAQLAAGLAEGLQRGGWSARAVALTLALEDGPPLLARRALGEPASDPARLRRALLGLLQERPPPCAVESVRAAAEDLAPAQARQLELLPPAAGAPRELAGEVAARLAPRHARLLLRAAMPDPGAQLPEGRVRLERFAPELP